MMRSPILPLVLTLLAAADAPGQCSEPVIGSTVSNADHFGSCMAMDGPRAVIGSPRGEGTGIADGTAFVFERDGRAWTQTAKLSVPQVGCVEEFGAAVGLDGDLIVGGAPYHSGVALDDLVLSAANLPSGQAALLFAGTNEIGLPFGDGRLCTGGAVVRVETRFPDSAGAALFGPGIAADAGFTPGEVHLFQVWYRDPQGPCGSGFNTSNGVALRYAP